MSEFFYNFSLIFSLIDAGPMGKQMLGKREGDELPMTSFPFSFMR
jgi:hypothetical protein